MRLLTYILFCFLTYNVFACSLHNDVALNQKVSLSNTIVEGTVISKKSVWLANANRIVTINTVAIDKNFTSKKGGTIEVITNGGIVNDEWHTVSNELNLELGNSGLFFLGSKKNIQTDNNVIINGNYAFLGTNSFLPIKESKNSKEVCTKIYDKLPKAKYSNSKSNKNPNTTKSSTNQMGINCIYPNIVQAGNNDTLYITGYGFGANENFENAKVYFADPNTGGFSFIQSPIESYVSWSDTEIVLVVPPVAGSGLVKVENANFQTITSFQEIEVSFALKGAKKDSKPTYLIDKNGLGGYTFTIAENMKNSLAEEAFERAMNYVQNELGFNIAISNETTNIIQAENDGIDIVAFETASFPISGLAVAYTQHRRCGNGWEVAGFDIIFKDLSNSYSNWNFSEAMPNNTQIDFESVALHEILHTFQLNHNVSKASVMYHSYAPGTTKRVLNECLDLRAAHFINERSLNYVPTCSGYNQYQALENYTTVNIESLNCEQASNNCTPASLNAKVFLQGYYVGNSQMASNYTVLGLFPTEQPFNKETWNYQGTETLNTNVINTDEIIDWVLVDFYAENDIETISFSKAAILRNDGILISADGNNKLIIDEIDRTINYFISITHSNHLCVKSTEAINLNNNEIYDFSASSNNTQGGVISEMEDGIFAMCAGDFDGNGIINNQDYNAWAANSAATNVYLTIDADGNGVINNLDYNKWAKNRSRISAARF